MTYATTLDHRTDSYILIYALPPKIKIGVRGWTARTALKTRGPANVMNYTHRICAATRDAYSCHLQLAYAYSKRE